ncbi:Hypothetical predicted protein [Mytilus galloprovincialis]|uniref:GP-PDE domain-containing protein n=1 Tax=Mytilus galloprovincialis TaxID=29158 RepID=A0A8B6GMM8_MYTGA|nr:Hypothetical predicted protein [Mytilus galloprovincialis]
MVNHAKLQYYKQNYCLVCMTGLLGCRWHRYKQSTRDSRKRDLVVFTLVLLTFLFIDFLLYYVLIAKNDVYNLNWYMFWEFKKWISMHTILLAVVVTLFCYLFLLMILSVCHVINGHQLYTHPVHIVFVVLCLCFCIAVTVVLDELWKTEWAVVWLSLKITGPFLQIGVVTLMTALTWIIAKQWLTLSTCCVQFVWLTVYLIVMSGLYISPLFIESPCVKVIKDIPHKPNIIGHRGAPALAPENTLISFQTAMNYNVYGIETDIRLSYDGVPFVFHDSTFRRTTNIADVFPDYIDSSVSAFNISEIKQLNVGSWFLKENPFGTVGDLSDEEKNIYNSQSIPTFEELLTLVNKTDLILMMDVFGTSEWHPEHNRTIKIYMEMIKNSGIPKSRVWVTGNHKDYNVTSIPFPETNNPVQYVMRDNFTHVNFEHHMLSGEEIMEFQKYNITTNVFQVSAVWLYSLYWCMGLSSVTSDKCHVLERLKEPIWHLPPRNYLILWIAVDVLSALAVITIFIVQRIHHKDDAINPESVSLNSRIRISENFSSTRSRRSMKEKLLIKDVTADIFDDPEGEDYGIEANYTVQSLDGQAMARELRSNRQQDDRIELT